jgi:prolyl oligopeptidase
MKTFSLLISAITLLLAVVPAQSAELPARPATALQQLFDDEWQRQLSDYPVAATAWGDKRYNDRWADESLAAHAQRHEADQAALKRLLEIDRAALPAAAQLNYELFRWQLEDTLGSYRFRAFLMPVSQFSGPYTAADELLQITSLNKIKDYEDWISRLESFGRYVDQTLALMKQGVKEGRTPPRLIMQRVPRQIAGQMVNDAEDSRFYEPFRNLPASIPEETREWLRERARTAIRAVVLPALARFGSYFNGAYLPACRDSIAASSLPDGREYYADQAHHFTTTALTPDQIHDTGLREIARIRGEMDAVIAATGFKGDFRDFLEFLRNDPQFFFKTGDELLSAYRVIAKRIDPELARLFGKLPRTPYGVAAVPDSAAPDSYSAYYQPPAGDGSRAGYFYANLYQPESRPKWEMEALTLHESVPGHHLQIALATEAGELPDFRRAAGFTAFVEGWGLYSESLGAELGMYQDPYSKFGRLSFEMWRAIRLVVDTGIHAKGWTRERAIQLFKDNTGKSELDIENEVDRYIVWPGQALAYKIGELKIKELRARAAEKLGDKFDVRAFHDVVLANGAVPLDVLERIVDEYIAGAAAQSPTPSSPAKES